MKYFEVDEQLHFMEACSKGDKLEVEKLLRSGKIDPSFQHEINKWTALHWAAKRGHDEICSILLRAGFDPSVEDSQGKTIIDVCSVDNMVLRNLLEINKTERADEEQEVDINHEEDENKFIPNYIKYPNFPYAKQNSLDNSRSSPTIRGYYSYGRRDSVTKTRFLLVRTSCEAGKEAFKRITLPGGSTVKDLKKTIENAMKCGSVKTIVTLPDNIIIEENSQIEAFDNCQKIDVIFGDPSLKPASKTNKKDGRVENQDNLSVNSIKSVKHQAEAVPEEGVPNSKEGNTFSSSSHEGAAQTDMEPANEVSITEPDSKKEEMELKEETLLKTVEVTTDFHFSKVQSITIPVTENVSLPNVLQENEQFSEKAKNWTTARQVAAVAAAASLVGLGCYIYKIRK